MSNFVPRRVQDLATRRNLDDIARKLNASAPELVEYQVKVPTSMGTNVFAHALRSQPQEGTLRVLRNGTELLPLSDYTTEGMRVWIKGTVGLLANDVLTIRYTKEA